MSQDASAFFSKVATGIKWEAVGMHRKSVVVACPRAKGSLPISSWHIQTLHEAMAQKQVTVDKLTISGFAFDGAAVDELCNLIDGDYGFQEVDLSACNLGNEKAARIVRAVARCPSVATLNLSFCNVGVRGAALIAKVLDSISCKLRHLVLKYNAITAQGLGLLLKWACGLTEIDCRFCGILEQKQVGREQAVSFLEEGLKENTACSTLLLTGNGFKEDDRNAIEKCIRLNRRSQLQRGPGTLVYAEPYPESSEFHGLSEGDFYREVGPFRKRMKEMNRKETEFLTECSLDTSGVFLKRRKSDAEVVESPTAKERTVFGERAADEGQFGTFLDIIDTIEYKNTDRKGNFGAGPGSPRYKSPRSPSAARTFHDTEHLFHDGSPTNSPSQSPTRGGTPGASQSPVRGGGSNSPHSSHTSPTGQTGPVSLGDPLNAGNALNQRRSDQAGSKRASQPQRPPQSSGRTNLNASQKSTRSSVSAASAGTSGTSRSRSAPGQPPAGRVGRSKVSSAAERGPPPARRASRAGSNAGVSSAAAAGGGGGSRRASRAAASASASEFDDGRNSNRIATKPPADAGGGGADGTSPKARWKFAVAGALRTSKEPSPSAVNSASPSSLSAANTLSPPNKSLERNATLPQGPGSPGFRKINSGSTRGNDSSAAFPAALERSVTPELSPRHAPVNTSFGVRNRSHASNNKAVPDEPLDFAAAENLIQFLASPSAGASPLPLGADSSQPLTVSPFSAPVAAPDVAIDAIDAVSMDDTNRSEKTSEEFLDKGGLAKAIAREIEQKQKEQSPPPPPPPPQSKSAAVEKPAESAKKSQASRAKSPASRCASQSRSALSSAGRADYFTGLSENGRKDVELPSKRGQRQRAPVSATVDGNPSFLWHTQAWVAKDNDDEVEHNRAFETWHKELKAKDGLFGKLGKGRSKPERQRPEYESSAEDSDEFNMFSGSTENCRKQGGEQHGAAAGSMPPPPPRGVGGAGAGGQAANSSGMNASNGMSNCTQPPEHLGSFARPTATSAQKIKERRERQEALEQRKAAEASRLVAPHSEDGTNGSLTRPPAGCLLPSTFREPTASWSERMCSNATTRQHTAAAAPLPGAPRERCEGRGRGYNPTKETTNGRWTTDPSSWPDGPSRGEAARSRGGGAVGAANGGGGSHYSDMVDPTKRTDKQTPALLNACLTNNVACKQILGQWAMEALRHGKGAELGVPIAFVSHCGLPDVLNELPLGCTERVGGIVKLLHLIVMVPYTPVASDEDGGGTQYLRYLPGIPHGFTTENDVVAWAGRIAVREGRGVVRGHGYDEARAEENKAARALLRQHLRLENRAVPRKGQAPAAAAAAAAATSTSTVAEASRTRRRNTRSVSRSIGGELGVGASVSPTRSFSRTASSSHYGQGGAGGSGVGRGGGAAGVGNAGPAEGSAGRPQWGVTGTTSKKEVIGAPLEHVDIGAHVRSYLARPERKLYRMQVQESLGVRQHQQAAAAEVMPAEWPVPLAQAGELYSTGGGGGERGRAQFSFHVCPVLSLLSQIHPSLLQEHRSRSAPRLSTNSAHTLAPPLASRNAGPDGTCMQRGFCTTRASPPFPFLSSVAHTTQHNTTQHNTTQHNTTQHNTTQHNTTQRTAIPPLLRQGSRQTCSSLRGVCLSGSLHHHLLLFLLQIRPHHIPSQLSGEAAPPRPGDDTSNAKHNHPKTNKPQ